MAQQNSGPSFCITVEGEVQQVAAGKNLGSKLEGGDVIFLKGRLGAGKTTFCKGVLAAFGYGGAVKSPTYTLVEPYELAEVTLFHFDLYRLGDVEELEFMGIRDYFSNRSICLIEWPDKGFGALPEADIQVDIHYRGENLRAIEYQAGTARGRDIVAQMEKEVN